MFFWPGERGAEVGALGVDGVCLSSHVLPFSVASVFWFDIDWKRTGLIERHRTLGPAIDSLIGGPLINRYGWPWALYLNAIVNAVQVLLLVFTFRETQYTFNDSNSKSLPRKSSITTVIEQLPNHFPNVGLSTKTFALPLRFLESPIVILIAMTYGVSWAFASVGMATIVPIAFEKFYDFGIVQEGLVFTVVLVGVIVGGWGQAAGSGL
jgi:MFS family permease